MFSPWNHPQENYANCGPTSLSYCLFTLFGEEIDQDDVAKALYSGSKRWYKTTKSGFDQDELRKIAKIFNTKTQFLQVHGGKKNFEIFNKQLIAHLKTGNPAMLSVNDGGHWIAVQGHEKNKRRTIYYVNDPNNLGDRVFDKWTTTEIKREYDKTFSNDDYFAILLSRKDGKDPTFLISKNLSNLVASGSFDTLSGMTEDLKKIADISSKGRNTDSYLADHLIMHKKTILRVIKNLLNWDCTESDFNEVSMFYVDYITVARASRIKMSKKADIVQFTAYMTSLLTTCAWCGEV